MSKKNLPAIGVLLGIGAVYVVINMALSQVNSPLFAQIVYQNNQTSAVTFLQDIKNEPEYQSQLEYFREAFGPEFDQAIQKNSQQRVKEIERLKTMLDYNPQSRDILIELAILSYYQNDPSEVKKYYQQAQKIDPTVKIKELETIIH